MSGNIVPKSISDTYAVVDKAKKKNNNVPQMVSEPQLSDSAIPSHYMVTKTMNSRASPDKLVAYDYTSTLTCEKNTNTEKQDIALDEQTVPADMNYYPSEKLPQNKFEDTAKSRRNLLVVLIAVMTVGAIFACLVAAFVEIALLKSEMLSIQEKSEMTNMENINSSKLLTSMLQTLNNKVQQQDNVAQRQKSIINSLGNPGQYSTFPALSCVAVLQFDPSSPSSYYWVRSTNGSAVLVYCDMTRSCGGIAGGWIKVAELNMNNNGFMCPNGLISASIDNMTSCVPTMFSSYCSSIHYHTNSLGYTQVCGMIRGYGNGSLDGFDAYNITKKINRTDNIDDNYVDGVSLTHGMNPRQHIWTFAVSWICPCLNKPTFVGIDIFCDSLFKQSCSTCNGVVLWDGYHCNNAKSNTPWFHKELLQPTSDDIEMRVCRDQSKSDEDIGIQAVELYIQ